MAPLQVPLIGDFSESPTSRYNGIEKVRQVISQTTCHFATDRVAAYPGLSTGTALPTPAMTLAAIEAHGGQPPSHNPGRGIRAGWRCSTGKAPAFSAAGRISK